MGFFRTGLNICRESSVRGISNLQMDLLGFGDNPGWKLQK